MDDVASVTERLVAEFAAVDSVAVMQTVCTCCDECESASPYFIEHAARARLRAQARRPGPGVRLPSGPGLSCGPGIPTAD